MEFRKTGIAGLVIIKPRVFEDERGYFFESYNEEKLNDGGLDLHFVQDNQSSSARGVVRGLHYQLNPRAQTKLVRVMEGRIWDVAVDLRKGSPTYLKWEGVELSHENRLQLLIPKGFAHGFSVLSKQAVVLYKCDDFYAPDQEAGIRFDDPELGVDWKLEAAEMIISDRDRNMPLLSDADMNFSML